MRNAFGAGLGGLIAAVAAAGALAVGGYMMISSPCTSTCSLSGGDADKANAPVVETASMASGGGCCPGEGGKAAMLTSMEGSSCDSAKSCDAGTMTLVADKSESCSAGGCDTGKTCDAGTMSLVADTTKSCDAGGCDSKKSCDSTMMTLVADKTKSCDAGGCDSKKSCDAGTTTLVADKKADCGGGSCDDAKDCDGKDSCCGSECSKSVAGTVEAGTDDA